MKEYPDEYVTYHKGYDIYCGFVKWRIAKNCVERGEKFTTHQEAIDFIDKELVKKALDIKLFVSHADKIETIKMKKIFLSMVGQKQIEKKIMISILFYVPYGDFLLLVPFYYTREGTVIKSGVNLYNFLRENKLIKIEEIFKKEVTIIHGKIAKNNITIYDCTAIDWGCLLNMKMYQNWMKGRVSCPLDN